MDIKLIKAYSYEKARVFYCVECSNGVMLPAIRIPREFVRDLEVALTKLAGWNMRDNKCVFIFDAVDKRHAISFHDYTATLVSWGWHKHGDDSLPANVFIK